MNHAFLIIVDSEPPFPALYIASERIVKENIRFSCRPFEFGGIDIFRINLQPMKPALGQVLITQQEIDARIAEMARQIGSDYSGRAVTLVGILKGSFVFLADLIRAISPEIPLEVDFMAVSSYENGT